jgi:putative heme-binding domain-containing protein
MTPTVQRSVAELCTTRWQWRWQLFGAVEKNVVRRGDLPPTVIRTLVSSKEQAEQVKAQQLFGKVNATSTEKLRLIAEKRKVVVEGAVDLKAGQEQARKSCLICHKMYGEGAEVGPDLTGVGRSSLDALLHNVIHPNEIIGQGYENVIVETKDGRTLGGRVVENSDSRVRLLMAGPVEEVISKADVKSMTVSENSVMPEGLEQIPDADFRNLIWYILAPPQDGKPLDEKRRKTVGRTRKTRDRSRKCTAHWRTITWITHPH